MGGFSASRPPEPPGGGYEGGGSPQFAMPSVTPVVKKLLFWNFGIFVALFLLSLFSPADARAVTLHLGLRPSSWSDWFPLLPVWQLVTAGFLHSVHDLFHVLMNMVLLYFFGTMLESITGSRRFLGFYLAALVSGAVFQLIPGLLTHETSPCVGASGAVLGVVVGMAVLRPRARIILLFIPLALWVLATAIVAIDVFALLVQYRDGTEDAVGHWAHLGGAAFGFAAARFGWIWKDPVQSLRDKRARQHAEQRRGEDQLMDELLDKIHREGMSALSRREKDFLKRVSRREQR